MCSRTGREYTMSICIYREALERILSEPVKVVTVDSEKEFIHLDKEKNGWRLIITKGLLHEDAPK